MIKPPIWPTSRADVFRSPFMQGDRERNFKITFHSSALTQASPEEKKALEILFELIYLPEIEAIDTTSSELPYIEIGEAKDSSLPITLKAHNRTTQLTISSRNCLSITSSLSKRKDVQHPVFQAVYNSIIIAQAHYQLTQDILITLCPYLLKYRLNPLLEAINIYTPSEAVKVVGLFLRSRGNFTCSAKKGRCLGFDKGLFYWVLTRHQLPNMWRYFSACVMAEPMRKDQTIYLGQSILTRCTRALVSEKK